MRARTPWLGLAALFLLPSCLGGIELRRVKSFAAIDYGLPEKYVTLGGVRLCFVDEGRGNDVLVLIHPALANLKIWRDSIVALRQTHRVIALDLPGFGKSDKPPRFRYHPDSFAQVVARLLDHLGIARATLIGNSNGGGTAIAFALRYPERVARLVLVAPTGVEPFPPWLRRALKTALSPLHFGTLNPYLAKPAFEFLAFRKTGPLSTEFISDLLAVRGAGREYDLWLRAQSRMLRATMAYDASKRLAEIKAPTLVVWGSGDRLLAPRLARVLHGAVKGSQLTMLPGIGHMPEAEVPGALTQIVRQFLAQSALPAVASKPGEPQPPSKTPVPAAKEEEEKEESGGPE